MPSRYAWENDVSPGGRYRDKRSGRFVAARTVRRELDDLLFSGGRPVQALAEQLRGGEVSLADWQLFMRRQIKNANLAAVMLERGGRNNMTPADWGRAGQVIREQYAYLQNFAHEIATGKQRLDGTLQRRMQMYLNRGRQTFYQSKQAHVITEGWTHVGSVLNPADHCQMCKDFNGVWYLLGDSAYRLPGDRTCRSNCKCSERYGKINPETGEIMRAPSQWGTASRETGLLLEEHEADEFAVVSDAKREVSSFLNTDLSNVPVKVLDSDSFDARFGTPEDTIHGGVAAIHLKDGTVFIRRGYESDAVHELIHAAGALEDNISPWINEGITQSAAEEIGRVAGLPVRQTYGRNTARVNDYIIPATRMDRQEFYQEYIRQTDKARWLVDKLREANPGAFDNPADWGPDVYRRMIRTFVDYIGSDSYTDFLVDEWIPATRQGN